MISYPFTSQVTYDEETDPTHINPIFDRAVDSSILRVLDKQDYTDGVCINPSTCFKVSINTGMNVTVGAGSGRIQGVKFFEENDRVLQVQASESLDRIDTVVLRLNDNILYRNVDLYILKGTAEATPVAPTLTRTSSVYELGIANLFIAKETTTITQERITDTRQDSSRCGYSIPIQAIDTTALYNQYEDAMDTILEGYQNAIDGTTAGLFNTRITTLETETQPITRGGTGATTTSGAIANLKSDLINLIYPVGAIYMSVSSTSPATLFGGTWVAWGSGRVPVGINTSDSDFNTIGKMGGEKTHILTAQEVPLVTGSILMHGAAAATNVAYTTGAFRAGTTAPQYTNAASLNTSGASSIGTLDFTNSGGNGAHNNLQPYITCYMWKRTA